MSPVIDARAQHPIPKFLADPMFETVRRWARSETIPAEIPLHFTTAAMETAKVERALLSAWHGPKGAMITNDQVAGWVRERPDLYSGIASVDISQPMKAVRELRRCVEELGMVAVRILPWLWELPPDDRRYYPIYAACIDLDVPFCLQVGHAGPMRPSEPGRPIPYLDRVACDFPELVIVGGHIGYPWTEEMISMATKYDNVYIDTSAYTPMRYPATLVEFMRGRGRTKVMFGTNWPMIPPAKCLEQVDLLQLDADARADFLAENARRVFKLPESPATGS